MVDLSGPGKILLITQWFDPEPTFKGLLFAKELAARGFKVEVVTGFPNYPGGKVYEGYRVRFIQKEVIDGVTITRVPLFPSHNKSKIGRVFNYISFAVSSLVYLLTIRKKPMLIYAYHPPLTVGVVAVIIKFFRRIPVVLDIQDMWPDTLLATGMIKSSRVIDLVSKVCNFVYARVTKVVVLSPGFKNLLVSRGVSESKINVIYNWADESALRRVNFKVPVAFKKTSGFKILFAGNIGMAQGLDVVLNAAMILKDRGLNVGFYFLGNGLKLEHMKSKVVDLSLDNIHFLPHVGMDSVGDYLRASDALLIHLNAEPLFEITIPGKTQAYMAVGKPIVMGVKGDASDLVREAGCGVCFEPENSMGLVDAVASLMELDEDDLKLLGDKGRQFYEEKLSVDNGVTSFARVFNEVLATDVK